MAQLVRSAARYLPTARVVLLPALFIAAVPLVITGYQLTTVTTAAVTFIVVLGFNVVFGYAGMISFGHAAFALLGAYTVALGHYRWDWGYLTGAVVATVLCTALGVITAVPTLRMAPFAIAVVTLLYLDALNSAIQYYETITLGGDGVPVLSAGLETTEEWYLVAGIGFVAWLFCRNLIRSPLGRSWAISRVAPELAESLGVRVAGVKAAAVGVSAGLAGLGGAMWPIRNGFTSPDTYDLQFAILVLVVAIIGGLASVNGPFIGSVVVAAITLYLNEEFASGGTLASLVYALIVLAVVLVAPGGAAQGLRRLAARLMPPALARPGLPAGALRPGPVEGEGASGGEASGDGASRGGAGGGGAGNDEAPQGRGGDEVAPDGIAKAVAAMMPVTAGATLRTEGVSWSVGGIRILDSVDLEVRPGTVHGLIGPNGAGKTSLLNCVCGHAQPSSGRTALDGTHLSGKPSRRSRRGVSRTFQHPSLLEDHTVLENVLPGVDSQRMATYPEYVLRLPRALAEHRRSLDEARGWLTMVGLRDVRDEEAGTLSPGQRRLLEIARALATRPKVRLMDEPAAGLTASEIRDVERIVRAVAARGVAVVLIEHHFDLIQRVCDEVTVLDAGAVIFRGTPAQASVAPEVVEAYLGVGHRDGAQAKDLEGTS